MGIHTATRWNRLNIGPRVLLGFAFIILSVFAADAVILWQFHVVRTQAERLSDVDQKLVAVVRVHTTMLAFHDQLEARANAEDAAGLVREVGRLRAAILEDIRRATTALSLPPFNPQRDPTILPTLQVIQSALPSHLDAITTLAGSGDWRAVHLRIANQVRPLESLTSALVEKVDRDASEQHAGTVRQIGDVQRGVYVVVPLIAVFTLAISATLGLAITRSITQPLARLVEGSKAWRGASFSSECLSQEAMSWRTWGRCSTTRPSFTRSLRDTAEQRRSPPTGHRYDSGVRVELATRRLGGFRQSPFGP